MGSTGRPIQTSPGQQGGRLGKTARADLGLAAGSLPVLLYCSGAGRAAAAGGAGAGWSGGARGAERSRRPVEKKKVTTKERNTNTGKIIRRPFPSLSKAEPRRPLSSRGSGSGEQQVISVRQGVLVVRPAAA